MKTITGKTSAWITSATPPLQCSLDINRPAYYEADMTSVGWTRVGDAEITIAPPSEAEIVASKVAVLRTRADLLKERCAQELGRIEGEISSLLAIEHKEGL